MMTEFSFWVNYPFNVSKNKGSKQFDMTALFAESCDLASLKQALNV